MNRRRIARKSGGITAITLLALALALILSRPALVAQGSWPKRFEHAKGTVVMSPAPVGVLQGRHRLTARAAVSVKTEEMKAPVFGALGSRAASSPTGTSAWPPSMRSRSRTPSFPVRSTPNRNR